MQSKEPLAELGKLKDSLMETSPLLGIGLTAAVCGIIMGGLKQMFGDTDKIPKGVVKELMEGAISGIMEHFEVKIDDMESDISRLEKELASVNEEKDRLSTGLDKAQDKIEELKNKLDKKK